jgi:diacylglycerol kinase (ATP)
MERVVPATVFVNPSAGRGGAGRKVARVREAFARQNYSANFVESTSAENLRCSVRAAIDDGCATLIALGGDGTAHSVANEAIGRQVRVGIIPAGGGNDFAAALGIPENVGEAVGTIVRGECRTVDVVRVRSASGEDSVYLGGGGMGLDVESVRFASGTFSRWPGKLRYLASAIAALRGFKGVEIAMSFPGSDLPKIERTVLLAAVLNTPTFGGGLRLAPEARVDDGLLDVVIIEMLSILEALSLIPRLLISGELRTQRAKRVRGAKVKLTSRQKTWFQGDGELLGVPPMEIEALPGALSVLAPK